MVSGGMVGWMGGEWWYVWVVSGGMVGWMGGEWWYGWVDGW